MKKINKVFAVLAVVCGVLMMASCGLKDAIDATHNKWYKYNSTLDIPLGDDSSESTASSKTLAGAEVYLYFDDDNGVLVVIQKETVAEVDPTGLGITQKMNIITGAKKQYSKDKFGSVQWSLLVASGKIVQCNEPEMISRPDKCYDISTIFKEGVQWKKVLARFLLNQYLGE